MICVFDFAGAAHPIKLKLSTQSCYKSVVIYVSIHPKNFKSISDLRLNNYQFKSTVYFRDPLFYSKQFRKNGYEKAGQNKISKLSTSFKKKKNLNSISQKFLRIYKFTQEKFNVT